MRDERSGRVYNFSHRRDVLHTEIFLPSHLERSASGWAGNREMLWNTAEHAEKRSNSRVAREFEVSLPHELPARQQIALARALSHELTERYKVAVDLAVHLPRPGGDPRNVHAHLLTTTREITPKGLGAKVGLDMNSKERSRRELPTVRQEFMSLRERWANLTNEALQAANITARVDHRSLAAQGIDREPQPRIPIASLKMEQRGVRSVVADRIREGYRRRVQARLERATTHASDGSPARQASEKDRISESAQPQGVVQVKDVDEIRRRAREAWVARGTKSAAGVAKEARHREKENQRESPERDARGRDDDLAL